MKSINAKYCRYALYTVISIVFLALYSTATSPLTITNGADSSFFIMVAKGMKAGMLPYRDFFDMKGPYLFFIEYIGQIICEGRTGAYIIQCINLAFCLCVVDGIYAASSENALKKGLSYSAKLVLAVCASVLIMASFCFEGGNLTEEFSLPFLLISLKLVCSYFRKSKETNDYSHPVLHGLFYGFAFGFFLFYRINNAFLIGAVLLTVSVCLVVKKKFKNLFLNGATFLGGALLAAAPVCIFFASKGMFREMLEQVFTLGFKYSTEYRFISKLADVWAYRGRIVLFMLFPLASLLFLRVRDRRYWLFSVSSYVLLIIAVAMGNAYLHYLTLGIPNLVFGVAVAFEKSGPSKPKLAKKLLAAAVCTAFVLLIIPNLISANKSSINEYRYGWMHSERIEKIEEIKEYIPKADYDSVYAYNFGSCSIWYIEAGLFPANRYCDWQDHYMKIIPAIEEELSAWLSNGGCKWVVVSGTQPIHNQSILEAIEVNYTITAQNERYILYHKN